MHWGREMGGKGVHVYVTWVCIVCETGLLLNLKLIALARLADQQTPGILLPPPPSSRITLVYHCLGGVKLRSLSFWASSLPTEPSAQSHTEVSNL